MRGSFYVVAIAAATFAVAGVTLASANSTGSSDEDSVKTIAVFAPTVQFEFIDLGPKGTSLGDQFVFSDDLLTRRGGQTVGFDGGVCTIVRRDPSANSDTSQCVVTFSLAGGQITSQHLITVTGGEFAGSHVGPITGGSGKYSEASGEVTVEFLNPEGTEANITLSVTE
jgi:hypothetical protein